MEFDEVTYDLLVNKISQEAKERIEADAAKTRARITILATAGVTLFVAALTGVATFALSAMQQSIKDTTSASIEVAVPRVVRTALGEQLPQIKQSLEDSAERAVDQRVQTEIVAAQAAWNTLTKRTALRDQVDKIASLGGFNDQLMREVISDLTEIGIDKEFRESPEFAGLLEKVIDQQAGADRLDLTDKLVSEFEDIVLNTQGIAWTLTLSYGRKLVTFSLEPAELTDWRLKEEWDNLLRQYFKFSGAARQNNLPEIPLIFDVIVSCMLDRPTEERVALLIRVDDLTENEFQTALSIAAELRKQSWRSDPDYSTAIASRRAQICAEEFADFNLSTRANEVLTLLLR